MWQYHLTRFQKISASEGKDHVLELKNPGAGLTQGLSVNLSSSQNLDALDFNQIPQEWQNTGGTPISGTSPFSRAFCLLVARETGNPKIHLRLQSRFLLTGRLSKARRFKKKKRKQSTSERTGVTGKSQGSPAS